MNENTQQTGTGFNNVAGGIGSILGGVGGGKGVGSIICSIKGNCIPENITYLQPQPTSRISPMMMLIIGGALVVVLVLMLKK